MEPEPAQAGALVLQHSLLLDSTISSTVSLFQPSITMQASSDRPADTLRISRLCWMAPERKPPSAAVFTHGRL